MEIKIPRIHQTVNNSKKRLYIFWFCVQFFFSAISQDHYQLESKQITIFSDRDFNPLCGIGKNCE